MFNYLFKETHNGHVSIYRPFLCEIELTQEMATELIISVNHAAGRIGGGIEDLGEALDKKNVKIIPYNCVYRLHDAPKYPGNFRERYDPLPSDFKDWPVIKGISGNY